MYGSLASSHYNLALRCIQTGCHSPMGTLSHLIAQNYNLKDVDPKKVQEAQRVEEALSQESLLAEPKQSDPSLTLVAPTNRDCAPPNVQHVPYWILKGMHDQGVRQDQACHWDFHQSTCLSMARPVSCITPRGSPMATSSSPPPMRRQCMDPWQVLTTTWPCCASRQGSIHKLGPCLT